jgi:RNA polymerase sigma-70 factor (ECF subfamily)
MEGEGRDVEALVRGACVESDFARGATLLIEAYGAELFRFVRSRCRDDDDAREVFAIWCEDLWRGLPQFAWRCSSRCWAYKLARHAAVRFACAPHRRAERNVALSDVMSQVAERVASTSSVYAGERIQEQFRALRQRLCDEDQLVLVLRVDRDLGFREIAQVLAPPDVELAGTELEREAARVRKRFELAKRRLRRWAVEGGLLASSLAR